MQTIKRDIVGAFIFSSDDFMLLGKSTGGGVYSDTWLIPGGGVEPGESKREAMKRKALEETGVDVSDATITQIAGVQTGQSEKTLRATGERVLVKMTFYDFVVELPYPASEIDLRAGDDFGMVQWHSVANIKSLAITPPMQTTLTKLGRL